MTKTGDTKKQILELLKHKNETLTDISNILKLAPSTVSQHLQELVDAGLIKQVDDRPRKWKYYEINKNYVQNSMNFSVHRYVIPTIIVLVIAIFAFGFYLSGNRGNTVNTLSTVPLTTASLQQVYLASNSTVPQGSTVFSVSDAPTSYNITSLLVTVDSAEIHSVTTGQWYTIPLQTSTFNLIKLKDISQVIAGAKLNPGIYDQIVFQVSNVTATANGTTQKVYLPNNMLDIKGAFNISNTTNSTNWINIDFNLESSLHIGSNGQIILLPVLFVRHLSDSNLSVNQSSIIIARGPGNVRAYAEYGMSINGNLVQNYSEPQNISIAPDAQGQLRQNGFGPTPIIIRSNGELSIGGDAGALLNISSGSANATNATSSNLSIGASAILIRRCYYLPIGGGNANALETGPYNTNCIREPICDVLINTGNGIVSPCCNNCEACLTAANSQGINATGNCCQAGGPSNALCNNCKLAGSCCRPGPNAVNGNNSTANSILNCCNWGIVVPSQGPLNNSLQYRKCIPIAYPMSVNANGSNNASATAYPGPSPSTIISATALNNGAYINWNSGNNVGESGTLSITNNNNSNVTTNCTVSNGALICAYGNGLTRITISKIGARTVGPTAVIPNASANGVVTIR